MAKLAPPKKTKVPAVVSVPKPTKSIEQAAPDAIKPIQLKIPESSKNEFKAYAAMRGLAMNDLFLQMFDEYKENNS
jgi:hypothetical protein